MNTFALAPLLLLLPFLGMLFNLFAGARLVAQDAKTGEKWSGWIASSLVIINFIIVITLMSSLAANDYHTQIVPLWDWFAFIGDFYVPWAMQIDTLSVTMMAVVTGVGALIHIYAIGYMHGDPGFARFFAYLNLFIFFMLILVTGNNYLMLFVGWEGVGLCSFLLIGFWYDRKHGVGLANSRAARKAFIANRVGDAAMILAMILTFWTFSTLEFEPVFHHAVEMFESNELVHLFGQPFTLGAVLSVITVLFLIGATGKSAQIPLYIWLPDAMAGPTPVSALIHAATMVTSGIYLIVRSNVLFEIVRESGYLLFGVISTNDLVALIGASTALWAGLIAFTQWDVKKVLAYSTVSQLGFMIAAVGMGAYVAGLFHLITHAIFKALLFMGSGSIIHGMEHGHHHYVDHHKGHGHDSHGGHDSHDSHDHHGHDDFDPQDMRTMGGLRHQMPWTFWTYIIGTMALAGIFPFAGFWSKDEILAHASWNMNALPNSWIYPVVYGLLTLAAICTAFYMGRQIKMVFFGAPRSEVVAYVPESDWKMILPLVVLAFGATVGGLINLPYFTEAAYKESKYHEGFALQLALEHAVEHAIGSFHLTEEGIVSMPYTPTWVQMTVAVVSTVLAVLALLLAVFVVYRKKPVEATDPDPLQVAPLIKYPWAFFAMLPLDTLLVKGFVEKLFNPFSGWLGMRVDWDFWHDFVHNNIIRDTFNTVADFLGTILDPKGVDGVVRGLGKVAMWVSGLLGVVQSGNVGNYALGVFLGVVALVTYVVALGLVQ
jgi:NADH-quinone oxidoreductase subunit L